MTKKEATAIIKSILNEAYGEGKLDILTAKRIANHLPIQREKRGN